MPSAAFAGWRSESIDNRAISKSVGVIDRGVQIDKTTGYPHIFYSSNFEDHAYFDGTQWQYENIPYNVKAARIDSNGKYHIAWTQTYCEYYAGGRCAEWDTSLYYSTNTSGTWVSMFMAYSYHITSGSNSLPDLIKYVSLTLDSNDKAHIIYTVVTSEEGDMPGLYYTTNQSGLWVKTKVESFYPLASYNSSLTLDSNGRAHISYFLSGLKYATNESGSWVLVLLDAGSNTGSYNSIASDSNNKVHITYSDADSSDLRYLTNVSGSWDSTAIDHVSVGGTDIAVDSTDHLHISYADKTNGNIKYITNTTGSWTPSVVAQGFSPSVALDLNDKAHIDYDTCNNTGGCVHEARYATNSSGLWITSSSIDKNYFFSVYSASMALDSHDNVKADYFTSDGLTVGTNAIGSWDYSLVYSGAPYAISGMAIDTNDKIHMAYVNSVYDLLYITNAAGSWTSSTIDSTINVNGNYVSVASDSNGKVHISYFDSTNSDLKYATNISGAWVRSTIDSTGVVGTFNSIAVDSNGKAHISYYDSTGAQLKYATNASGAWVLSVIDNIGDIGRYTSSAVDSGDKVHIVYNDTSNGKLKYATNVSGAWVKTVIANESACYSNSIAVDSLNKIHVAYRSCSFLLLKYGTNASGSWVFSDIGNYALTSDRALFIDADNYAHITDGYKYITNAPSHPLTGASLAAGSDHTLLIKPDGTLWAWGLNDKGHLGDGTTTDRLIPVKIGNDTDWASVAAGWKHSIALKKNGTLWAWGDNEYAQLGDGTTTDRLSPVQIGSSSDWIAIAAGAAHNLALKKYRTLWAWGGNWQGQIGDGTATMRLFPVQIGSDTNWTYISAGWEHSAALKSDNSLYTWGWNSKGQLGDGSTTDRYLPVKIGANDWTKVAAGWQHTVAVKTNDTLLTWGYNEFGQLGDGTTTDRYSPVQISGINNIWIIKTGGAHTLVRTYNGELWSWGLNSNGQLGDGTPTTRLVPVQLGTGSDWGLISAGWEHSEALKEDGSFWSWGFNGSGQLGDGTTDDEHSPITLNVPRANFTGSPLISSAPLTVNFANSSAGLDQPLSYQWDFDDDGTVDSTEINPSYTYSNPGTYTVKLTVADSDGDADTLIRTNYITVSCPLVKISGVTPTFYSTIQDAYNAASYGDTVEIGAYTFVEPLNFNQNKAVTLKGGYNCDYSSVTGKTTVNGKVVVSNGNVTIENIKIN